jgi:hypothetical protein
MQMVFGDGDKFLYRFASCLDVIGHELTVSFSNRPQASHKLTRPARRHGAHQPVGVPGPVRGPQ